MSDRQGDDGVLVERERELAALDRTLDAASAGAGGALLLEGDAGLGKSRLLGEARERARRRGMRVLDGRALESEREFPFAVALQLLETTLATAGENEREDLLSGAAGLARPLLTGAELDHARSTFSILHGLYWVVVNMTHHGSVLLCVDDLHWSDEGSLRWMLHLVGRLEGLPAAVVLAARPHTVGTTRENEALATLRRVLAPERFRLRALEPAGVGTVVRASLKRAEDEFCVACAEVTGGNPFALRQLVLMLAEERISPTAASVARLQVLGQTLLDQAAVLRLVGLGPDAIALARAVAVLGDGTPLRRAAVLARLAIEPAADAADALAAQEILTVAPGLSFVHPLVREAVDTQTPGGWRGIAHLRAARLLADDGATPEQIASQLLLASPAGEAWVVQALRDAARRARGQGAPGPAAHFLQRALEEPPEQRLRCQVLMELGDAEAAAGIESAANRLRAALELEADPEARATIARLLGRALAGVGRQRDATVVVERALDELGDRDGDAAYALVADYLSNAMFEGGLRQRAVERATALLHAAPLGTTPAKRGLLAVLAMRSGQQADPVARTIELADRAWRDGALLADQGPDGPGWLMITWALTLAEDFGRAEAITAAAIDAARRGGSLSAFADASYFHGYCCYRQGRLAEAQADAEQAIVAATSGWRRYLVAARILSCNVLVERGELDAAGETLALAVDQGRGMFEGAWLLHAHGRVALAFAKPEQALEQFEQAGSWLAQHLSVQHTVLPWRTDAARAALAVGDRDRARGLIEPVLGVAEQAGARVLFGRRLAVLGLIEGGERGIELLQRAVRTLACAQASLEHAYALADLGSALRRAGRRADSRPVLEQALDLAHRLGAAALALRVREELLATGARPRRELIAGRDSLTPSERRVAELAAQGLTNPRIAQALFVTPKTVEFHLRHVYQKLAIDGRAGLAAALRTSEEPDSR